MRALLLTGILFAEIIFSGCTVGPNYQRQKVQLEKSFAGAGGKISTNAPVADWWKTFKDPELNRLVAEGLQQNLDLQMAVMRIRESRFQRNLAAADLFPNVDADAGYAHSRGSKNVVLPLGGGSSGSPSTGKTQSHAQTSGKNSDAASAASDSAFDDQLNPIGKGGLPGADTDLYQVGFDATWEIDIFGGTRRRVEAATDELAAAIEANRNLQVTLLAEIARDYFELRGTQARLVVAQKNLAAQKEVLKLTRSQQKVGLANDLAVSQAAAQVATMSATLPPLAAGSRRLIHSLSILLAREPEALNAELTESKPLPPVPPEIPIGLPSQLLERRPDIRQAERQIAAATAKIGSARADLFPKFALIGSAGLDSSTVGNLFAWDSRYFLISPTVTWRIFDAGRIVANIHLQRVGQQEAVLQYRGKVLQALQEVEDALLAYATDQTRRASLLEAVNQNRQSLVLAQAQYHHGLVSFLNVLDAERNVFAASDALEQSNQAISTDLVALYKALGGGWQPIIARNQTAD